MFSDAHFESLTPEFFNLDALIDSLISFAQEVIYLWVALFYLGTNAFFKSPNCRTKIIERRGFDYILAISIEQRRELRKVHKLILQ